MIPGAAGVVRWSVMVAAVAILLGHVCAVPLVAETIPLLHHHVASAQHEHGSGDGDVHAGSCEMAEAPSAPSVEVGPGWTASSRQEGTVPRIERVPARPVAPHATSPPLFLIHAALLI